MTSVICKNKQCKKVFQARTADVKRGWGKFCCKSCKAIEQENRTGQYKKYCNNVITKQLKSNHQGETEEFFANYSNEDDGDFDWAYEESDFCTS